MTDKKGNNIILPCTKPAESTENADGVKPAYFRKSETVRGKKKALIHTSHHKRGDMFQPIS